MGILLQNSVGRSTHPQVYYKTALGDQPFRRFITKQRREINPSAGLLQKSVGRSTHPQVYYKTASGDQPIRRLVPRKGEGISD